MKNIWIWVMAAVLGLAFVSFSTTANADSDPGQCVLQDAQTTSSDLPMSFEEGEEWTLEQAIEHFGAERVCGVPCGQVGRPSCKLLCGMATACFYGHCIYL